MTYRTLCDFVAETCKRRRIGLHDVRRLARDILPDGITSRVEADLLLTLDRTVAKADPAWATWLVAAMVEFAVWGTRPTGRVDAGTAAWLNAVLTGEGASKRAALILHEIVREAEAVGALETPAPHRRPDPVEPELAPALLTA
jgi:hypothetical protein